MVGELTPVTGAWRPGDDIGHRQFFTFATDRRFAVDSGATLTDVTVAYETWGRLAPDASNAVLICHAWTGDSHAAGPAGRGHISPGWWDAMIGPGHPIDPVYHGYDMPAMNGGDFHAAPALQALPHSAVVVEPPAAK